MAVGKCPSVPVPQFPHLYRGAIVHPDARRVHLRIKGDWKVARAASGDGAAAFQMRDSARGSCADGRASGGAGLGPGVLFGSVGAAGAAAKASALKCQMPWDRVAGSAVRCRLTGLMSSF